jgi:cyclic pyranopterin phosphate synthase
MRQALKKFSHLDARGAANMVDVSAKPPLRRKAVARGEILMQTSTIAAIENDRVAKGNVFATARVAGIMAAKNTGALIPLCHPLPITHCGVDITASARVTAATGVEMEALTAVSLAALTIYDMCKAVDKTMRIRNITLLSKSKR